jgi:DNA-binding transcriptional LysR family regulator
MDARHLELLRQLADRGTVTAVAAATHRTPSAVSQQLRTAEREAGVPLVEPHGRGLRLTRAGGLLADGAVLVATALARVQADLDALRDAPQGAVAIGALPSAAEVLLPELLVRLRGGAIRITVDDFDLAEADFARRARDHDLVIGHTITGDAPRGADHLHRTTLAREPLDVAVPAGHPLAARDELTPDDVVGERWIAVPEGYPFDTVLVAMENLTGRSIDRVQRVRDNRVVEALVAAGVGLALLPRFTTRARPGVVTVPLTGVGAARHVVALARRDVAERRAVRTVLAHLAEIGAAASSRATARRTVEACSEPSAGAPTSP